jgi:hypothetical protein
MHAEASHDMAALKAAVAASLKREEELKQQLEQIQWLKREEELKQQLEQMGEARAQGAKEALRRPTPEPAIILVMSSRTDRVRRDAIRETWAKGRRDVKFLVGRYGCEIPPTNRVVPDACEVLTEATESEVQDWTKVTAQVDKGLDEEMQQHNDTLLLDMVDDYRALKLKLGYVWAVQNTDASWIIKTDDDVYLRPAAMQAWFGGPDLQAAPRFTMVAGSFDGPANVPRQGKWREIKYPLGAWPDYPVGATHAVTRVLAQYVANHVTSLVEYEGEDVSMGVWMAQATFHKEVHLRETELFKSYRSDAGAANCILDMEFLSVSHNIDTARMRACYQHEMKGSGPVINDIPSPDMDDPTHTGSFGAKEGTVASLAEIHPAWEESIDFVIPWSGPALSDDANDVRQRDNGEMKYLLRSIAMHAPWVRKVWVLVNGVLPAGVVELPPSIANRTSIVDRCSYMPQGTCPTRNGFTVRAYAHHLPGLAEHWVLIDDDIFLGRPIKPSFFFWEGVPFVWRKAPHWGHFKDQECHALYENPDVFNFTTPKSAAPSPHFWYPQLKSVCESTEREFPEFYEFVGSHKDGRFWSGSKLPGENSQEEIDENSQEEDVQGWYECVLLQSGKGIYKDINELRHTLWDEVLKFGTEAEFKMGVRERVAFMNFNGKNCMAFLPIFVFC